MDQLGPVSAPLSLCWAEVLHFSKGERGLINLTVERQYRCAGNKRAGHRYWCKMRGRGFYFCSWLAVPPSRRGRGSTRGTGGKHMIFSGRVTGSHLCRQATLTWTKNKRNIVMQPLYDLCKHFSIWTALDFQNYHFVLLANCSCKNLSGMNSIYYKSPLNSSYCNKPKKKRVDLKMEFSEKTSWESKKTSWTFWTFSSLFSPVWPRF